MANLSEIKTLALHLMAEYKLVDWKFQYTNQSTNRFGFAVSGSKVIGMNPLLVSVNTVERCKATILHEIAHAIVGTSNGHNEVWKAQMVRMGLKPDRCFQFGNGTEAAPSLYHAFCCDKELKLERFSPKLRYHCPNCKKSVVPVLNPDRHIAKTAASLGISTNDLNFEVW